MLFLFIVVFTKEVFPWKQLIYKVIGVCIVESWLLVEMVLKKFICFWLKHMIEPGKSWIDWMKPLNNLKIKLYFFWQWLKHIYFIFVLEIRVVKFISQFKYKYNRDHLVIVPWPCRDHTVTILSKICFYRTDTIFTIVAPSNVLYHKMV